MKRPLFQGVLLALLPALLLALLIAPALVAQPQPQPNLIFINIDDLGKRASHLKKWNEEKELLLGNLASARRIASAEDDLEAIDLMVESFGGYEKGFNVVKAAIDAGLITTTQQANMEIDEYQDLIRGLEGNAEELSLARQQKMATANEHIRNVEQNTVRVVAALAFFMRQGGKEGAPEESP